MRWLFIKKTELLIVICVLLVSILAVTQYIILRKNYNLSRKEFYRETADKITRANRQTGLDSLQITVLNNLAFLAELYREGRIEKRALILQLNKANQLRSSTVTKKLNMLLHNDPLLRDTKYTFRLESAILYTSGKVDTLLSSEHCFVVAGYGPEHKGLQTEKLRQDSLLIAPTTTDALGQPRYIYQLKCKTAQYIDASSWQKQILISMLTLFFLSVGTIIAVVLIVYFLLRVIFRQKELAVIHTDFTNNVNHELNTPLASLELIIKKLRRPDVLKSEETLLKHIDLLERQHSKIKNIVDQVLEISASDTFNTDLKVYDINAFLRNYTAGLEIPDRKLRSVFPQKVLFLQTDITILEKMLDQLINNAVKYSEPGTTIRINACISNDVFEIRVKDQGAGISEKYKDAIFNKFYRIPDDKHRTVKGLGLGLFYCRQAVSLIGGTIHVSSLYGQGSSFIVRLPITIVK